MTSFQDFEFRGNFGPGVTAQVIDKALARVNAQWYGMINGDLWASLPSDIQAEKIDTVQNLLVAWYLANMFPDQVVGGIANGALPLSGKSIDGVSLSYKEIEGVQGELKLLATNQWGVAALQMFQSAPERMALYPGA